MDQAELEALVLAQYDTIYAYCWRHVGQQELARDLTQTTFLRFWQHRDRYRHDGRELNYLYTIAGNLCKDWCKRKKPVAIEDLPESQRDPGAPAPDRDTALTVRAALAALPFEQRNTLLLCYEQGFTAAEIAAITHTTVPAVRYRLHRAKRRLEQLLKEELP